MATGVVQPQLLARRYTQTNAQVMIISLFLSQEQQHTATGCVLIVYLLCSHCVVFVNRSHGSLSVACRRLSWCWCCVCRTVPACPCLCTRRWGGGGGIKRQLTSSLCDPTCLAAPVVNSHLLVGPSQVSSIRDRITCHPLYFHLSSRARSLWRVVRPCGQSSSSNVIDRL